MTWSIASDTSAIGINEFSPTEFDMGLLIAFGIAVGVEWLFWMNAQFCFNVGRRRVKEACLISHICSAVFVILFSTCGVSALQSLGSVERAELIHDELRYFALQCVLSLFVSVGIGVLLLERISRAVNTKSESGNKSRSPKV